MGIREKRLENDFKELSQLVSNSGDTLAIASSQGQPPNQYVIEYRCRGIEKLQEQEPVFRTHHRVEINLSSTYPKEKPTAKFLTPILHPNVYTNLNVCLGNYWTMAETLSELVIRIGKIIQYSDDVLNLNSPANSDAKIWAANNRRRFPVDTQNFKSAKKPSATIVWNDL
ncbi:MAG: ubiquitin-conjugating enzyme E2 [Nostoc sp.]|uniref:ubiquitin-conjugating enzyme E2 n=1 Tax=Nostoc sp. TaxID=1180 RepID=UPI002FFAAF20